MRFEFVTAPRIVFGCGSVREVPPATQAMGKRALLVTGRSPDRARALVGQLHDAGVEIVRFAVEGEPSVDVARTGSNHARTHKCDLVIAFGGGSVLDAGKAIAAMATNPGDVSDYLEVVGKGQPLTVPPLPLIAVPTTAGTGTEVTRNAVLAAPNHGVKVSMRSPMLLPRLAVIDPDLTLGLPPPITAATGLDALTQLIEPFVSVRANPVTDAFCREGLARVRKSLRRAFHHGDDLEARTDMSLAALLGGLALANAGLGVIHGFAGPIGGKFPAPHGAVCAALLPYGMEANIHALKARAAESVALRRYDEVGRILTGQANALAEAGVGWVRELCREFEIPPLRTYGVTEQDVSLLAENAARASSTKGNPIPLSGEELADLLRKAI